MRSGELFAAANIADGSPRGATRPPRRWRRSRCRAAAARSARSWPSIAHPRGRAPRFAPGTLAALLGGLEPGAIALENALRVQRAEALSVTDDLTQLYNSRYLSQVLRRETKRASRSGRPLSLLFVDLDGFKAINDTHGHLFGSRALVEAAGVIRLSARETDMVARFGGDEFALILPDTGSEGAAAVGDRIRDRVAAFSFLAGGRAGYSAHRLDRRRDAPRRRRVGGRPHPGRRRGDVLGQGAWQERHLCRRELNFRCPAAAVQGVIVESSFSVLAVLQRSRDRSRDGQHLRLRARARASSSTSRRSSRSTR